MVTSELPGRPCSFFELATNTPNVRNNDGDKCSVLVQNNGGLVPDIMYGYTYSKCMDQPCKVAHPARGQLNRENELFPVRVQFAPENLVSRDSFGSPVPRQPAHLHTLAESGAHSSHSRLNVALTYRIPPHTVLLVRRAACPCSSRITCYRRIVQFISLASQALLIDHSLLLHVVLLTDAACCRCTCVVL